MEGGRLMVQDLVLVCAGTDSVHARESGLPLLQFGLRLQGDGGVARTLLSSGHQEYLGVTEQGLTRVTPILCSQLLAEADRVGAKALFVDCESHTQAVDTLLHMLDEQTEKHKIRLFVPLCQAQSVTHAHLVADTAISGGCIQERFQKLVHKYPERIAADLRAISRDFLLPSADTEGAPLSTQEREALQTQLGVQPFFSRELCARYFTYMDKENNGHFVLFDDADTLQAKCRCLEQLSVSPIFARYSDIRAFLPML